LSSTKETVPHRYPEMTPSPKRLLLHLPVKLECTWLLAFLFVTLYCFTIYFFSTQKKKLRTQKKINQKPKKKTMAIWKPAPLILGLQELALMTQV
jgi:hypothetical protein